MRIIFFFFCVFAIPTPTLGEPVGLQDALLENDIVLVQQIIELGADVNDKLQDGNTPLHLAAAHGGNPTMVNFLLSNGAEINVNNKDGETPLHIAAKHGHSELVDIFISNGALVNEETTYGWTALHFAAANGHDEVAKVLIAYGGKVDLNETKTDDIPLQLALKNGHSSMVALLLKNEKDISLKKHSTDNQSYPVQEIQMPKTESLFKNENYYHDRKNGYFIFLPPEKWLQIDYADPRTKVKFQHPANKQTNILIIAQEATGDTLTTVEERVANQCENLRLQNISCDFARKRWGGRESVYVEMSVPNVGPSHLVQFIENDLFFNISLNGETVEMLENFIDIMEKSISTIKIHPRYFDKKMQSKKEIGSRELALARLFIKQGKKQEACKILKDGISYYGETADLLSAAQQYSCILQIKESSPTSDAVEKSASQDMAPKITNSDEGSELPISAYLGLGAFYLGLGSVALGFGMLFISAWTSKPSPSDRPVLYLIHEMATPLLVFGGLLLANIYGLAEYLKKSYVFEWDHAVFFVFFPIAFILSSWFLAVWFSHALKNIKEKQR